MKPPELSDAMRLALQNIGMHPAVQAAIAIEASQTKLVIATGIEMPVVERWTKTLFQCAVCQVAQSNSSFVVSHLDAIYDKLAAGGRVDSVEFYLQDLRDVYL